MNKFKYQNSNNGIRKQKSKFLNSGLLLFIFIFGFFISSRGYAQDTQETYAFLESTQTVSMDFKDVGLKDVLKALSIQAGVNFIASQEISERTVTLYLSNVPVTEALDKLFKANKLDYEFDEKAKIIIVKEGEPIVRTITKVFPLKYASVSSASIKTELRNILEATEEGEEAGEVAEVTGIADIIRVLLSGEGSVVEDARTNALIVTDIPARFPVIEQAIKELDVPLEQVMLEVEIIDVKKSLVDKMGINFASSYGNNPFTLFWPEGGGPDFFMGDLLKRGSVSKGLGYRGTPDGTGTDNDYLKGSVVLGSTFAGLLDFFHSESDTRYLARPRILTMNNETAEIKIVTDQVVGEETREDADTGDVTTTPERVETGVFLRVTPQINSETGEITMVVHTKVIEASTSAFTSGVTSLVYVEPEERGSKSIVKVRDGETIILGGLIRNKKTETLRKIPILGDIPFLGALFRHRDKTQDIERELLVFITPHIVNNINRQGIASEDARLLSIETALNSVKK